MIPPGTPDSPGSIAGIPDPIPGEPPDLRRAVLDEIEDHLHCATQRELRRAHSTSSASDRGADLPSDLAFDSTSDSPSEPDLDSARRRAIDRFGDPAAIARRLWLDAMKGQLETLMTNRILIGFNIVLLLAVVVLGGLMVVMVRDGRSHQRELVAELRSAITSAPSAGPQDGSLEAARVGASYDWPSVDFEVQDEDSGSPISDVTVLLYGEAYDSGKPALLRKTTDAAGVARLGPMRPGSYQAMLQQGGRMPIKLESFTVRPGPENRRSVRWPSDPDPASIPVAIDVTWPESVTDEGVLLFTRLWPSHEDLGEGRTREHTPLDVLVRRDGSVALLPARTKSPFQRWNPPPLNPAGLSSLEAAWGETIPILEGVQYSAGSATVFAPASEAGSYTRLSGVDAGAGFGSNVAVTRDRPLTLTLVSPESAEAGRR